MRDRLTEAKTSAESLAAQRNWKGRRRGGAVRALLCTLATAGWDT